MGNEWEFTLSERTQMGIREAQEEGNSLIPFLADDAVVVFGHGEEVTSSDLYASYERWCDDNAMKPLAMRTVASYMKENSVDLGVKYTNRVQGKRGYVGIGLVQKIEKAGRFTIAKAMEA
jgi:putative DNA primase/helicase